jgi:isocitrate/isopropylmalate dehydrogenase
MGEASRALAEVARLHSLRIDEVHLPFGGEAMTRVGHPLPLSTRNDYRSSDAVFVSAPNEPALDGVKTDLDLAWRVSRVALGEARGLLVVEPIGSYADELAVERAFELAAARRGRLAAVRGCRTWRRLVGAEHEHWPGLEVDHLTLGEALVLLRDSPESFDVAVADSQLGDGFTDAASHLAGSVTTLASAWLPVEGPGLFAPHLCDDSVVAGLGVADPAGTLLAASLLLGEGLGQRSAARTLERAVAAVLTMNRTGAKTRSFTDAVIERLPDARTDTELFEEVWR